ncbi:unnamed protein product, partial [Iphiclides podalirius]
MGREALRLKLDAFRGFAMKSVPKKSNPHTTTGITRTSRVHPDARYFGQATDFGEDVGPPPTGLRPWDIVYAADRRGLHNTPQAQCKDELARASARGSKVKAASLMRGSFATQCDSGVGVV